MRYLVLILALAACKKSKPPADAPPPPIVLDGEAAAADEQAIRAGKRTGLETPDSKPEVATEPLLRALLAGQVPWTRFVDATAGVVELRGTEVTRRCGAELDQSLATFAAAVTAALADPGLIFDLVCDNAGLTVTIAGVTSHAVCTVSNPAEEGMVYDVVFVPDAARGLKLIGLVATDVTADEDLLDAYDEELGRYGARCP